MVWLESVTDITPFITRFFFPFYSNGSPSKENTLPLVNVKIDSTGRLLRRL